MDKTQALEKLRPVGQLHLLNFFDSISETEKAALLTQIEAINIPLFRLQQQMLASRRQHAVRFLEPYTNYAFRGNQGHQKKGKTLVSEGKAGCLLIAGGQGTRLKFDGPKGMFPVSLLQSKSLFQIFAEKVAAAGKQTGRALPLAIMTSPLNHVRTLAFFAENNFFGLDHCQIEFFTQETLPALDHDGNLFLDNPHHIAEGPNGNGSSLKHFIESGIWQRWYEQGIRYAIFNLIDNALADPFDYELIGNLAEQNGDVGIKCTFRRSPEESVGILVKHEDKVKVMEYSEVSEEEKRAVNAEGKLKHLCANLSLFCFSMDFIKSAANVEMPLHLAHKSVPYMGKDGILVTPNSPNSWKYETFIFDVLSQSLKVRALMYPREECFAPLKNVKGEGSLEDVQKFLLARDRQILSSITGEELPQEPIELSQDFYYPTEALLEQWKGKRLPAGGYIAPNLPE